MFKAKSSYEVKVGDRLYQILCEPESPLSEVIDVLAICQKNVQKLLDDSLKAKEETKGKCSMENNDE